MAARVTRRAAARRNVVVDDPVDDLDAGEGMQGVEQTAAGGECSDDRDDRDDRDDKDDSFSSLPERKTRGVAAGRRRTTKAAEPEAALAQKPTRSRRSRPSESTVEPTEVYDAEATLQSPPTSPSKQAATRISRTSRKSRDSISLVSGALPTPEPSVTPEPAHAAPLSDITEKANNTQLAPPPTPTPTPAAEPVKVKPMDTVMEKPMDIVIRTRALGVPQTAEPEEPKARMVIKYLNLTNFKSYAGRQEVGPFHGSFSSVVGPNGSGKSNVIDSLLFVFGFRASKMRQGKISALIHNSANHPDLAFCEVEVVFEEVMDMPGGGHQPVPDSTLTVSRKAYRNNSSDYFINGGKSNFTTVTTLLKEKGIDLDHKRFLILQGEVESIAQMKPKAQSEHDDGLLEYLEDIIGTSKYKTPIEEAAAETEALNEVCKEKSNRVQIVEKEKKSLEDKKDKALAYVQDENNLVLKQAALYQVYQVECQDNLEVTEEAVSQMQAQLDEELGKHQGSEDVMKQLDKSFKKTQKEYEALEKQAQGDMKEKAKFEKERVKFDEKRKFLTTKQKKLEKALHSSHLAASEARGLISKYEDDISRSSAEISELEEQMQQEINELAAIRDSLKGKTQAFSDAIAEKQASLEPWNEKITKKESDKAVTQSELDILQERAGAGQKALDEASARIQKIQSDRDSKMQELEAAETEKVALEQKSKKIQHELYKLAKQEPELQQKLSGARQRADEARSSLQSAQSQGNVLGGLMRLKESGRIEGFHGRLGNLGTIDQKYDVAISTACPQLDNLVADSVEVGQQCIDYLRKNNLGRANIICLDRISVPELGKMNTPENTPRLIDLVKPKSEMFRRAFYSVLQDTLVAKDLAQANRVAYGQRRWRVVTLDGQLIDLSGTMSGGGSRVFRGAMSSKASSDTSKEQVVKLEADREQLETEYRDLQITQRQLESDAKAISQQLPALETSMQKLELELSSLERTLSDAERRLEELSSEDHTSGTDRAQISKLEKSIKSIDGELEKLHAQTAGAEDEIKQLQDKIMEVGGVRLRMQKAKVDGLKEQIDTLNDERSNAEVAKSKAQNDQSKHDKAAGRTQKDLDAAAEECEQLDTEGRDLNDEMGRAREAADEAQATLERKKDEIDELKHELEEKRAELNETRAVELEIRNRLEENQKVYAENEKRLHYWADKLSKLTIQSVSDIENGGEPSATDIPTYTKDELVDMSRDTLKAEIAALEERVENASVDLGVLEEYRRRVEEHGARFDDLQSAVTARDSAKRRCDDLRKLRLEGFMQGFSTISLRLKEMYQMITMGGNAELELVDSLDPFSEGILFSVMPPKKSWKNISNLSGGEKTLSSLALVFALHHYRPTPLYVMDEIDAALDFRNVSIVASYIKERTKNAQFIVISLRNNMFELASRLVGVYKVNHMTKSVTVENKDYIVRRRA